VASEPFSIGRQTPLIRSGAIALDGPAYGNKHTLFLETRVITVRLKGKKQIAVRLRVSRKLGTRFKILAGALFVGLFTMCIASQRLNSPSSKVCKYRRSSMTEAWDPADERSAP